MKYTYVKENHYPVEKTCKLLNVSKSGYYEWLKRGESQRTKSNRELDERIHILFEEHENRSGYLQIHQDLLSEEFFVSKNRVYRRMREMGLKADRKCSFCPVAPNLLNQVFKSDGLNRIWLSDITYIPINGKWSYLFVIQDLFNREIVGWELGWTLETRHLLTAFEKALSRRGYPKEVIFHSDRGVQYASDDFRKALNTNEFIQSMSRKGNCYDNAPMDRCNLELVPKPISRTF
ncbi:IS3 family transposase [Leptospira mayottensis]|uniref:IS3 family transposase n=1 Tax=Leptospira mayottensis TaxID=1137606 RepID=UPI000E35FD79|nr:IS3 family transposase [Leptospira mayottensis]AXR68706.1 IS3 family transposase [Leptospira mayottensis]